MSVTNTLGIVIIEALKALKDPVPLRAIISKVASLLECPEAKIVNLVTETVKSGVKFGYIQRRRERFAYFPINLTGLTDDENISYNRKNINKISGKNLNNKPDNFNTEVLFKSCKFRSSCNIKTLEHIDHNVNRRSISTSARPRTNFNQTSSKTHTFSNSKNTAPVPAKSNKESQGISKSKWRV